MKKTYLGGLLVAALAAGIYMVGCGGDSTTGNGLKTCSGDSDCASTEACNTETGLCMTKCESGADCPSTAKNCDVMGGISGTQKVCQCSTDALCGGGSGSSTVCHTTDKVCETKCTDDSGCSGYKQTRTCDKTTGQCVIGTAACDPNNANSCPQGQTCNATTHVCETTGTGCGTNQTQGSCSYGQACFTQTSGGTACEQITQCSSAFNTSVTAGSSPVIFDVVKTGTRTTTDTSQCSSGVIAQFQGHFYDPNGKAPTSSTYSHIFYVTGTSVPGGGSGGNTYYSTSFSSSGAGTFSFELCSDLNSAAKGVYVTNTDSYASNTACLPSF